MMKKILCGLLALVLMLLPAGMAAADTEGASGSISENGITITLSTDKKEYAAGEEIHYTITVENTREFWVLEATDFSYRNSKGLIAAWEGSMPESLPQIAGGERYELEGVIIGDATVFPVGQEPTAEPTAEPTIEPTAEPTPEPTAEPTPEPTAEPTAEPTTEPTEEPTVSSTDIPTQDMEENSPATFGIIIVVVAGVIIAGVITMVCISKKKGGNAGKKMMIFLLVTGLTISGLAGTSVFAESLISTYDKLIARPSVTFTYGGQEVTIQITARFSLAQEKPEIAENEYEEALLTSCHDPSVFKDFDGTYYIFGTHMGLSKTTDLKDWTNLDASYRASYTEEVKNQIRAWNKDEAAGQWFDYLWAPDIIYNEAMGKYCIYLSANGDTWKSNIVMLTADTVTGPYDYAGTVVYGGFDENNWTETDGPLVTGSTELPERYITNGIANGLWGDMWPNCIDPCVFYDDEGNLWMAYGSWSGGIFMLELDENTGLRDIGVTYANNEHSDAYFGTKIAGGVYVSGEGAYIEKIGDYYWLFVSYGGLEAKNGYNVRVYRSEKPNGDYVDALGNDAYSDIKVNNYNIANKGVRLFGAYQWRTMELGEVAQGHNSAFVDDDGKAYMVYHTRTTNGTEWHYVKVHQLFLNKDGWLVAAPYQARGESLDDFAGTTENIAGKYEVILHELELENYKLDVSRPEGIYLNEDGTVTGFYEGTWAIEPGTSYLVLTLNGVTYSGVVLQQKVEGLQTETVVFTALGRENQLTVWGSKAIEQ